MAGKRQWLRSHVERLLQDEWETCRVLVDDDGDYPFRYGTASCWVTVLEAEPMMVRVFAHAAYGVRPTLRLLTELNEIQLGARTAAVMVDDGTVIVSQTLAARGVNRRSLRQALQAVGGVADDIGLLVAGMYGGTTPYPASVPVDEQAR